MRSVTRLAIASAVALTAGTASAATVDFESFAGSDPTNLGTAFSFGGIDFSSTEDMQMVGVGSPTNGFVPNDMPVPASFGNWFITGDFNDNTDMTMSFSGTRSSISFDIADIDGSGGNEETFTVKYFLGAVEVATQSVAASTVAGPDGTVTTFSFGGSNFDSVKITGTTPNGTRNIGWGLDNISAVPLPASVLFLLAGVAGLGVVARRRKAVA